MKHHVCAQHPLEAVTAICARCGCGLCSECSASGGALPCCRSHSKPLRATRLGSALAVAFSSLGTAAGVLLWRLGSAFPGPRDAWFWVGYAAVLSVVTWLLTKRGAVGPISGMERYRAVVSRETELAKLPLSLVWTTALAIAFMSLLSALLPALFHGPRWVAAETVIGTWWAGWGALFALLLYRGGRIAPAGSVAPPRARWDAACGKPCAVPSTQAQSVNVPSTKAVAAKRRGRKPSEGWFLGLDLLECASELFPLTLVLAAFLLLAWLLIELVLPASFFIAYQLVRKSLDQVANHGRGCQGRPGRALVGGVLWAAGYAMPLAMLVLLLHRFVRSF